LWFVAETATLCSINMRTPSAPFRLVAITAVLLAALAWWWRSRPAITLVRPSAPVALVSPDPRISKTRMAIQVGNETRDYVLSCPVSFEPGVAYPLVIGFHGYRGEVKAWFHEYAAFDALVAEQRFIIAYPEGPLSWEARAGGRDLPFFDALVAELRHQYPVDPARIHVVGHSNGANFATFLLQVRSQIIASGAVQAGAYSPVGASPGGSPPPLLLMWGEQDDGRNALAEVGKEYRAAGFTVEPVLLLGWGHAWGGPANQTEARALDFFRSHPQAIIAR
jgi:poly(3-hydroxybutyrate) depolymerase